ncbi:hypothetical protein PaG_05086 [Moesziomyces aphidis]|uniref:Uncharacterized protein n=1 Tax=Moesziomyces aphidis TaxID=84754 RepID=W3VHX2_MOEAP|nr:hypothetical protein PaG_05086 [Moesziomyces aphidis]
MMASNPASGFEMQISATQIPSSSPVLPTRTASETVGGAPTTVITQSFADRIMITITQLNKFGCIYQATTSIDPADPLPQHNDAGALPAPLPTTAVTKLVGTEPSPAYTALYHLYIAQLASIVKHAAPTDQRPLIVTLALKPAAQEQQDDEDDSLMSSEAERSRYMAIMNMVGSCRVW